MNKEQAIQILIQAVEIAQEKGAFTLKDANILFVAVNLLKENVTESGDKKEETIPKGKKV